jgi:apolipoprotein N-acyltransferase
MEGKPESRRSAESPDSGFRWFALAGLLFSGVVQAVISPPLNWVALHPLSWVPAFWVFSRLTGRRALAAGWLVAVAANCAIFYWIVHTVGSFSNLPTPVGVGVLVLYSLGIGFYCAVFAWGFGAVRRAAGHYWPFAIAAWFAICEFASPQLFPYFQGVAWYQRPSLFLIVSLTGVAGVTFLVIACNAIALQAFESLRGSGERPRAVAINTGILVALVLGAVAWSADRLDRIERVEIDAQTLRVALIQPNYSVERYLELSSTPEVIAEEYVSLSREALAEHGPIDIFVWPEKALIRSPLHKINRVVREFARDAGVEVWTGGDYKQRADSGASQFFNSAFRVDATGRMDRRYDKIVLLPFGEFMPLIDVFPVLGKIQGVGRYSAGTELTVYESDPARFVFLICYEAIRNEFVGEAVDKRANLLVNLTFDGWFGDTSEPTEHLMLAAVQSAQYGVPLVRSTTTGISAFVDARGMITERTDVFSRETLVADVKPMQVASPYAAFGDWFVGCCGLSSAGLLLRSGFSRRSRAASRS